MSRKDPWLCKKMKISNLELLNKSGGFTLKGCVFSSRYICGQWSIDLHPKCFPPFSVKLFPVNVIFPDLNAVWGGSFTRALLLTKDDDYITSLATWQV